jgi:hypothetical protein
MFCCTAFIVVQFATRLKLFDCFKQSGEGKTVAAEYSLHECVTDWTLLEKVFRFIQHFAARGKTLSGNLSTLFMLTRLSFSLKSCSTSSSLMLRVYYVSLRWRSFLFWNIYGSI